MWTTILHCGSAFLGRGYGLQGGHEVGPAVGRRYRISVSSRRAAQPANPAGSPCTSRLGRTPLSESQPEVYATFQIALTAAYWFRIAAWNMAVLVPAWAAPNPAEYGGGEGHRDRVGQPHQPGHANRAGHHGGAMSRIAPTWSANRPVYQRATVAMPVKSSNAAATVRGQGWSPRWAGTSRAGSSRRPCPGTPPPTGAAAIAAGPDRATSTMPARPATSAARAIIAPARAVIAPTANTPEKPILSISTTPSGRPTTAGRFDEIRAWPNPRPCGWPEQRWLPSRRSLRPRDRTPPHVQR